MRRYWINIETGAITKNEPKPESPHFLTLKQTAAVKCSAAIKAGKLAIALDEANQGISSSCWPKREKKIITILKAIGSAIFLTAAVGFLAICFLIDLARQLYYRIRSIID